MKITEKRLRQIIREAAAGDELDDHELMLGMAEELAERTADNFLQELEELLSDGPHAALAAKTVRRTILRPLRRTAEDAVAIAYDLE